MDQYENIIEKVWFAQLAKQRNNKDKLVTTLSEDNRYRSY